MAPGQSGLQRACKTLARRDEALARAYSETGIPRWRSAPPAYETLARLVIGQQISVTAAAAIWARLAAAAQPLTAPALLAASEDSLRACGLSRPKIRYLRAIAEAVDSGALDLQALVAAGEAETRETLLKVTGIGPWTADLYLLYVKGALDVFPAADIGLIEAYRQLSGAAARPSLPEFTAAAERWRPYRGVAAHLLWAWLNAARG